MGEDMVRCDACGGKGYRRCACWPGDCICAFGDEDCAVCDGEGWIYPDDDWEPSETDQGLIPIPKGYAEP